MNGLENQPKRDNFSINQQLYLLHIDKKFDQKISEKKFIFISHQYLNGSWHQSNFKLDEKRQFVISLSLSRSTKHIDTIEIKSKINWFVGSYQGLLCAKVMRVKHNFTCVKVCCVKLLCVRRVKIQFEPGYCHNIFTFIFFNFFFI